MVFVNSLDIIPFKYLFHSTFMLRHCTFEITIETKVKENRDFDIAFGKHYSLLKA